MIDKKADFLFKTKQLLTFTWKSDKSEKRLIWFLIRPTAMYVPKIY